MRDLTVALAQVAPKLGDVAANLDLHVETVRLARERGADLVVFPELSLTGYVLRDQTPEVALEIDSPELARLNQAADGVDVAVGFVEESTEHRYYNATAYLSGGVVHVHRKVYLPTYGMFDEGREFARGDTLRAFDTRLGRMGILTCEDAWHPTTAFVLAQDGAEILIVPSNGPTRGARDGSGITSLGVWRHLLAVTAQFQTSFVVYVNRVGFEDGLNFGGGSTALDPFGRPLVESPALDPALDLARLESAVLRRSRTAYPLLRDTDVELVWRELGRIRRTRYDLPEDPA